MKDEKKGTQEHYGLQNINHIVGQIRDDIKNIKTQFENLPPVPEGKSIFIFLTEASFSLSYRKSKLSGCIDGPSL